MQKGICHAQSSEEWITSRLEKRKEDQASRLGFLNLKTLCQDLTPSDGRLCSVEDIVQVGR